MQRGDLVVESVATLVEAAHAVGGGLGRHFAGDFATVLDEAGGNFEQVQRTTAIAIGSDCQRFQSLRCGTQPARSQPAFFICQCRGQQGHEIRRLEWTQRVNLRTRQQRGVHFEGRVFGSGAHEHQRAVFDIGQEGVLLRLVEAVHLVQEQERALACRAAANLRGVHHFTHILHARLHGGKLRELGIGRLGYQPRQRGLAGTRRPPEQSAMQGSAFGKAPQRLARAQQMALAHHFGEHSRPHAVGEWSRGARRLSVHRPTNGAPALRCLQPNGRSPVSRA